MQTVLSSKEEFVKLEDSSIVQRKVETVQSDLPFDPLGLEPQIANLKMNLQEQEMLEQRAQTAKFDIQAKIDALESQKTAVADKFDDLKAILYPEQTALEEDKMED